MYQIILGGIFEANNIKGKILNFNKELEKEKLEGGILGKPI